MSRPLRILVAGGLYHVTSRGNRREAIFIDDLDRTQWISVLAGVCSRAQWRVHAWCQMNNHYHVVVETTEANLAQGMRRLNGVYALRFNMRHERVGHVFQGRYHAVLVERQSHLLELLRYVVLNPVRAKMANGAEDWPWSSYRSTVGDAPSPPWLETDWTLAQLGPRRRDAVARFKDFVRAGIGLPSIWSRAAYSNVLGSDAFSELARRAARTNAGATDLAEIPRAQRDAPPVPLGHYVTAFPNRREAMAHAYASGGHSMRAISEFFGVHRSTVARAVQSFDAKRVGPPA